MSRISPITRVILTGVSATALLIATPLVAPSIGPAAAQTSDSISIEFRIGLTPYGSWRTVGRWGEVWVPTRVARDWQPYTVGNWVYSEDYGWYWISDSSEAEWGWITYHYGRWAFDDASGWVWVPDNVWGPAWVDWRRGDEYVGWSPLPPDDVVAEYRENPRFWTFVRPIELIGPRVRFTFLSINQRQTILPRTVAVNRTLFLADRRFGVNPGIAPGVIAAAARQSVRTVEVRPQVVAGTANIRGAIEVRTEDLRRGGNRPGQAITRNGVVQKTIATVAPAKIVPPPQALGSNEGGKLGDRPPRAAVSTSDPSTIGPGVATPSNQRTAPPKRGQEGAVQLPKREGAAPAERTAPPKRGQEGAVQLPKREGAAPAERTAPPKRGQEGAVQPPQREGAAPAERTAPPKRGQEGAVPLPKREGAAPAERNTRTPGTSGQAPAREERRGPAPLTGAQSTPKGPALPPAAAAPSRDENKGEDNKNK